MCLDCGDLVWTKALPVGEGDDRLQMVAVDPLKS